MNLVKEISHLWIKCMTSAIEVCIALFYTVTPVIVMGFIWIEIPDGSYLLSRKKLFKEKELSEISNISGIAVLQRLALLDWVGIQRNCT